MKRLRITVGNKTYDVTVEDLSETEEYSAPLRPSAPEPMSTPPPSGGESPAPVARQAAQSPPPAPTDSGAVTSPMAGVIRSVLVKPGDAVTRGQGIVVLEAMKMENQITAPVAGSVKRIDVAGGDSVVEGQVLFVLE